MKRSQKVITLFTIFALVIVYKISTLHLACVKLPNPTGHFGVGTTYLHVVDKNRKEKHDPASYRELAIQVYYPINQDRSCTFERYLKSNAAYVKQSIAEMKNIPLSKLNYINNIKTHAVLDAPISNREARYPVILFSPGFGSPQNTYTAYLEDLASHGYIVLGIDYPYVTSPTIFPDQRIIAQDPNFTPEKKDAELTTWLEDTTFLIGALKGINNENNILKNKLDLEKIGIMGHSFGGRMAVEAIEKNNQLKAGVDLDGKIPLNLSRLTIDKPLIFITAHRENNKDQELIELLQKNNPNTVSVVVIQNADHGTFTDLNLVFKPWLHQKNNRDPKEGIKMVREYIYTFFDRYLKNN